MSIRQKIRFPSAAFLACLFVSIGIWCVITFSKDYRVTYNYKIHCYNLPEGKESVTVSDSVLTLTFNQKGLKYLSSAFIKKDKELYISVKDLIQPKKKISVYTFTNKELCDFLSHHNFGSKLAAVEAPEVVTFYLQ